MTKQEKDSLIQQIHLLLKNLDQDIQLTERHARERELETENCIASAKDLIQKVAEYKAMRQVQSELLQSIMSKEVNA